MKPTIEGHMLMCLENHGYEAGLKAAKQRSANDPFRWPARRPMVAALPMAVFGAEMQQRQLDEWLQSNSLLFCATEEQAMAELFDMDFATEYADSATTSGGNDVPAP